MRVFLASIPLDGRAIAVIGSGEPALAKLRLALDTPSRILWFAPGELPTAAEIPAGAPAPLRRLPSAADLKGAALVFIALPYPEDALAVTAAGRKAGALVNVVDKPDLSDFHTPALIDRGDVVVGIATGGAAPVLARDVRSAVEAALPKGLAILGAASRDIRETVKATISDFSSRRAYWTRALRGPAAQRAAAGDEAGARREMLRALNETPAQAQGEVWIVGAGPGDPELLTLKAMRAIQDADVIVHDRLVSDAVLDYARRDARRIYVGKRRGEHAVPQGEIQDILIREAKAGHRVVRLKGGDPFVFGRGGEELDAVRAAGLPAYVVPGVTAALGCAASAGLPLTHRDWAQAVTLITGQGKAEDSDVDWSGLSAPENTLAVYMGVGAAGKIVDRLIGGGRDPLTPIAVVENGTLPGERVLKGVLGELELLLSLNGVDGPAILYIGDTAAFADARGVNLLRQEAAA
jgi:uroporphyrin-III C-methyltransferase / precorrin-2 dehydrogenase / sirohydrochlorin ferrochelatase